MSIKLLLLNGDFFLLIPMFFPSARTDEFESGNEEDLRDHIHDELSTHVTAEFRPKIDKQLVDKKMVGVDLKVDRDEFWEPVLFEDSDAILNDKFDRCKLIQIDVILPHLL